MRACTEIFGVPGTMTPLKFGWVAPTTQLLGGVCGRPRSRNTCVIMMSPVVFFDQYVNSKVYWSGAWLNSGGNGQRSSQPTCLRRRIAVCCCFQPSRKFPLYGLALVLAERQLGVLVFRVYSRE